MDICCRVCMTRTAISPRLATRTFLNMRSAAIRGQFNRTSVPRPVIVRRPADAAERPDGLGLSHRRSGDCVQPHVEFGPNRILPEGTKVVSRVEIHADGRRYPAGTVGVIV